MSLRNFFKKITDAKHLNGSVLFCKNVHHLVTSMVKSNINNTLKLKVTHFFVCVLYRNGIKIVFIQVAEMSAQYRKVLLSKKKKLREHYSDIGRELW